ncbi:hypothetical protein [Desulforhopalus sp. 52FAK]
MPRIITASDHDFSHQRLREMYQGFLNKGYAPLFFGQEKGANNPYILWRHDIDLELPAAVSMAELEASEGIKSTYFLMTRSWFYNLFSPQGVETVHRIAELGHQLGLHCDLQVPRDAAMSSAEIEDIVGRDFALLDSVFPKIFNRTVSFHNPPSCLFRRDFDDFYSTYQPAFFSSIKYLSDSNRIWREGPPEVWANPKDHPALSILLHPVIWNYPGGTMQEGMAIFLETQKTLTRKMLILDDVLV